MDCNTIFRYYTGMFDCFVAELLVIALLFICCARIFFMKKSKIDSFVIFSPIALLLSIINIFLWNISPLTFFPTLLAFFVFFTNIRSLLRFCSALYIDRYSNPFVIVCIIELFAIVLCAFFLINFRPIKIDAKDFESSKNVQIMSGNFSRGFYPAKKSEIFRISNSFLYTYEPLQKSESELPLIIFCTGNLSSVSDYEPYLLFLSKKGFTVFAADFFADDLTYFDGIFNTRFFRKFYSRYLFLNDKKIDSKKNNFNQELSYLALIKIAKQKYGEKKIFFISDSLDYQTAIKLTQTVNTGAFEFYDIADIAEYRSKMLGFVEQTDIFIAKRLKLERDKTLFIPRYVAGKTVAKIKDFNFLEYPKIE